MAKRHLEQYDFEGRLLEIYLNDDEVMVGDKTLEEKLGEMDEEIGNAGDGTVKSVTLNGTKAEPDENGDVELELEVPEQVQADWEEDDSSNPAYIKHKPTVDDVLDEDSENAIANKTVTAAIAGLRQAIETVLGEGSTTAIENFQEVLDFLAGVTDEETLIGLLNTMNTAIGGKLDKTDVYNGLDRTTEGKALDARQGKALNDLITALQSGKSDKNATVSGVTYDTTSHKLKQTINGTTSDVANVDTAPTANSDNFVTSGGVSTALATLLSNIHIGENGNWWIGPETDPNNDTGKKAQGPKGNSVADGDTFGVVNNLTDGGEEDALSAEMGKVLRINLVKIFNALGNYAFPDGKPELDWGSTILKYGITASLSNVTISSIKIDNVTQSYSSLNEIQIPDGKSLEITLDLPSNLYVVDGSTFAVRMSGAPINTSVQGNSIVEDINGGHVVISIGQVNGDVSIVASAITYIGVDGFSLSGSTDNTLKVLFDGMDVDSANNQWVDKMDTTRVLQLTGCTIASDHVEFDGDGDYAVAADTSTHIDVLSTEGTVEAVAKDMVPSSSLTSPAILMNSKTMRNGSIARGINLGFWYSSQYFNDIAVYFTQSLDYNDGPTTGQPKPWVGNITSVATAFVSVSNALGYFNGDPLSRLESNVGAAIAQGDSSKVAICTGVNRDNGNLTSRVGKIYIVRVYSKKLTQQEVLHNYAIDVKRFNIS